ncbi:hypothetical protein ACQ08L_001203 [Vibrio alginolyticus]
MKNKLATILFLCIPLEVVAEETPNVVVMLVDNLGWGGTKFLWEYQRC